MLSSIHRYFQLGTIQWMSFPPQKTPLLESVRRIASDDFFDAIEVTHVDNPDTRRELKSLLGQSHLSVGFGAQPCLLGPKLNPNALDESERQLVEDVLIACVDEAADLGAKAIAFLAGAWEKSTLSHALSQLIKTTCHVCDTAAKRNIRVELEVFDYDMAKCSLIGPAPLALEYASMVRRQCTNFGLLVDLSHFPTTYETSRFVIQTLRPYITHFHIGNAVVKPGCEAYGDEHPRFGFPNGANDVDELLDFFRVLRDEGFFREKDPMMLSFEVKPWLNEDAEIVLANTKRVINRAWALLEE